MLSQYLARIPAGEVSTFLCTPVVDVISQLELSEASDRSHFKVVVQAWPFLPGHESVLADILQSLATVSLAIWPSWYGENDLFHGDASTREDVLMNQFKARSHQATQPQVSLPWLKAAMAACQGNTVPILPKFSRTIQVAQLALAIAPGDLTIVLALCDDCPKEHRLLSFARAATWLAQTTHARVAVLVPSELADHPELASILYGAIALSPSAQAMAEKTVAEKAIADDATVDGAIAEATKGAIVDGAIAEEAKHAIWPIQGQPHPFSPGEQLLAKKLAQDEELAPLFRFNHPIETRRGSRYLVDLLWPSGKVVVEIDGYKYHGRLSAFIQDRHRDYDLLISGYLVLRLSHNEVVNDIAIALEKIRDVVRFRRNQLSS